MTPDEIRKRALLAASSVVLAFGPGCQAAGVVQILPPDTGDTDASVDTDTVDTDIDTDSDPVDTDTIEPIDTADTDAPNSDEPVCSGLSGDPLWACCDERTIWCGEEFADQDAQAECIWGPNYDGSTGCIPWGPPAPPRFGAFA